MTEDERDEKIRRLRRRRAASTAAYRAHELHPEMASENGRKGGLARVAQVSDPSAYGRWLANRRWYGELAGPPPPTKKNRHAPSGIDVSHRVHGGTLT